MQRRSLIILSAIGGGVLLIGIAIFAYVLRPTAAPSGELTAVPVELNTPEIISVSVEPSEAAIDLSETEEVISEPSVFEIIQAESEVRFIIDEILRGVPTTAVGSTDQIAAQLIVDLKDPSSAQVGVIQVNARTLATDAENRNRAIRNEILDTDEYELISFAPNELVGLPESVSVGESFAFQIVGDLTIRHITQQVSFETVVSVDSLTQLSGLASTTIFREDYELTIPQVPSVAGVDEDILLEIDFVALAQ